MRSVSTAGVFLLGVWAACLAAAEDVVFEPPRYAGAPQALHAVTNRAFTGIPSLAVSAGGRLWATWYAGITPGEDHNNYVVLSTSGDDGKTWKEVLVVDPDGGGPRRTFDPQVWIAPDGKLRWFWTDRKGADYANQALWMIELADPGSEQSPWKKPVFVTRGVMMGKPLVLACGEWALPVATWFTERSSKMVVSGDAGLSWTIRGGASLPKEQRLFDEHMFVDRNDGSIWLLTRTKYGIAESVSQDRGVTWTDLLPSKLLHPSARFFIRRLASGNLLLVKHGPLYKQIDRSHLTAYLSKDDGKTWEGGLLLDERAGVSYPDGQQTADGLIRIIYDYSRTGEQNILIAAFREEDVLAGKPVSGDTRFRQLVSKGSGGLPPAVQKNEDGIPFAKTPAGLFATNAFDSAALSANAVLFKDRDYVCAQVPEVLRGACFLRLSLEGDKTVRCSRSGALYFLTPEPFRNGDSMRQTLREAGFEKVALPEVRLFNPSSTGNFCTLYQKTCKEGDEVTIGKWAVPIFFP